jgi:hypothetical protein
MNKTILEVCSCGVSYWRTKEQTRVSVICHCDSCGKKWGEHLSSPGKISDKCVVCGRDIGLYEPRYLFQGNYCPRCCSEAEKRVKARKNYNFSWGDIIKRIQND